MPAFGLDHDAVADRQVVDPLSDLDDLPHELVPEDVALRHRRHVAVVEMQVRAADRRGGDPNDRVAIVEQHRVRNLLDLDGVASRPADRAHQDPFPTGCAGRRLCRI
jgi:hypothetical protein